MRIAYVDSSCCIAISLGEPGSRDLLSRLDRFDRLYSSNLLEAELKSALAREATSIVLRDFLPWMLWIFPPRRLTLEINQILEEGHLKGPDLWHLACALFLRSKVEDLAFLTLDKRQGSIAHSLGFRGF